MLPAYKPPVHYALSPLLGAASKQERAYLAFFRCAAVRGCVLGGGGGVGWGVGGYGVVWGLKATSYCRCRGQRASATRAAAVGRLLGCSPRPALAVPPLPSLARQLSVPAPHSLHLARPPPRGDMGEHRSKHYSRGLRQLVHKVRRAAPAAWAWAAGCSCCPAARAVGGRLLQPCSSPLPSLPRPRSWPRSRTGGASTAW